MRTSFCEAIDPERVTEPVSVGQLRRWSAPEQIMVATNLVDELTILPHAIAQARQSRAKIQLVHVVDTRSRTAQLPSFGLRRRTDPRQSARTALDRMVQQLRWVGVAADPILLSGIPEAEIPRFAKAFEVDRLLVAFEDSPDLTTSRSSTLVERVLTKIEVPVCVIGRHVSLSSPSALRTRNVTLAVSLNSDCQIQLGFASRLAQEARGELTVLHVSGSIQPQPERAVRSLVEVKTRLPVETLREAELFCPTEINVRTGCDPAEEILKHNSSEKEGVIVLCSSGIGSVQQNWKDSVTYRVLVESRYPVYILEEHSSVTANTVLHEDLAASKTSQASYREKDRIITIQDKTHRIHG